MSNETKETIAAPDTEQQAGAAAETKAKSESKTKSKADSGAGALKAVGVAACKRHSLAQAWVTSDGQVFPQEGDAKAHARNLASKEILKVTAK